MDRAVEDLDLTIRATVRQVTDNGGQISSKCTTDLNFCQEDNNERIFSVSFCNTTDEQISQIVRCAKLQTELCDGISGVDIERPGFATWKSNVPSTDLLLTCNFKSSDFLKLCDDTGECESTFKIIDNSVDDYEPIDYVAIDENATYKAVAEYMNVYGENEFQGNNIQSLRNNLFPTMCFVPTTTCRDNSSTGKPMELCSMIYSSSELGGLCFDWYLSEYNGLMAQRIDAYCSNFTERNIQWWPNEYGEVDPRYPEYSSNDCECVNRFSEPTYQIMREATNVVYNDACWYKVCIPDYNQLKPEINMFNPTCPSIICTQIVNIVNSTIGRDLNVNQYINCSTSYTIEQEIQERVKNVSSMSIGILLIIFIFLMIISLFYVGDDCCYTDEDEYMRLIREAREEAEDISTEN